MSDERPDAHLAYRPRHARVQCHVCGAFVTVRHGASSRSQVRHTNGTLRVHAKGQAGTPMIRTSDDEPECPGSGQRPRVPAPPPATFTWRGKTRAW